MSGAGLFGGGQIVNPTCPSQVNPLSPQANPYFNMAAQQHQNWLAQQAMQNYNQQVMAGFSNKWMFDGVTMDIDQFADQVFGADTPEKTMFLLKHKNNNN